MSIAVSIVIPAYNEEKRIEKTLNEYCTFFRELTNKKILNFEIIVVLNNCTDKTLEIVKKAKKRFKEIRFLDFEEGGKGFAIKEGFKDALKRENDLIGFVDADMATSPEAFYDIIRKSKNYDGIIASRWLKSSVIKTKQTFLRRIMSRGFNFIVRLLFFFNYRDTQCGAKIFKKKVIEKIVQDLELTEWAFDINLLYLCKKNCFKIKECPTIWDDKKDSKLDLTKVPLQMFSGVFRLRLIYSPFNKILEPAKFILKIGDKLLNKK